jgi:hypothetical protein
MKIYGRSTVMSTMPRTKVVALKIAAATIIPSDNGIPSCIINLLSLS